MHGMGFGPMMWQLQSRLDTLFRYDKDKTSINPYIVCPTAEREKVNDEIVQMAYEQAIAKNKR